MTLKHHKYHVFPVIWDTPNSSHLLRP